MRTSEPQKKCRCEDKNKCRCEGQSACGYVAAERNRYFTGKYMAARDFADEQAYFLSRQRLHNRLLHGWGVVCGLGVTRHPNPDCGSRWIIVHPGVALDCCGRELILRCATPFELPLPRSETDEEPTRHPRKEIPPPAPPDYATVESEERENEDEGEESDHDADGDDGGEDGDEYRRREYLLLSLRYVEEEIERVPALYSESGACDPTRTEANRVRECAELVAIAYDREREGCWPDPRGHHHAPCRDDCDEDLPGPGGSCLDPDCPCGEYVPLALISYDPRHPERGYKIDTRGRPQLPTPPHLLTHIVRINWPHGGEVTLAELNEEMGGRLEITFDRKLLPADDGTGISPYTLVVQYGGVQRDVEFLPYPRHEPPGLDANNECRVVFTIDPDNIDPSDRRNSIVDNVVYVTLKCDFVLDCHNNPVDGNFLRGLLPTGDGVPGGTFESWFRVVYEEGEEEERWQTQRRA